MKNVGLYLMQIMSFVPGKGLGKDENGRQYPVEVWQCTPENWCAEDKKSGVDRLFQPPHDCRPLRYRLGFQPSFQDWVRLPNVWRSVMRQRGECSEQEMEEMKESNWISRRIVLELVESIRYIDL